VCSRYIFYYDYDGKLKLPFDRC